MLVVAIKPEIAENHSMSCRFGTALTGSETLPKRHVFEILSAICVYSHIGYLRVIEGLTHVKNETDQFHRFSVVVQDLQKSENVAHKMAILTFINSLINCTPEVTERIRIRNEFIGLNLLDVLTHLRRTETDDGIQLQLEIFHERKVSDEEGVNADNNLDFNSPQDLLDLIQSKVFGTTRMVHFVNILQDLLSIETVHSNQSSKMWYSLDGLIHHIVHTMDGQGLDNTQSMLHKLPEQFGSMLQCVSNYQNSVKVPDNQGTSLKKETGSVLVDNNRDDYDDKIDCFDYIDNTPNILGTKNVSKYVNSRTHLQKGSGHAVQVSDSERGSQSSLNSDTNSQNRTVVLRRSQVDEGSRKGSVSSVNDETIIIRPHRNASLQSNDMSNCSSSGNETTSSNDHCHQNYVVCRNTSVYDNFENDEMKSGTFNISEDESVNGLNYNTSKRKVINYDQNKVGSKLGFKCVDILEEESLSFEECYNAMIDQGKGEDKPDMLKKNIEVSVMEEVKCCPPTEDVKHVNRIVREEITPPTVDLHSLRWITLPDDDIVGREPCIWSPALNDKEKLTVDVLALEQMFHADTHPTSHAVEEVVLLNANARLRINLFLSRLDCGAEDLVQHLEEGNKLKLTLPMLRYLNKVIPCQEEISMLRRYKGSRLELGMAEQFVLLLSDIPDYSVLIEGHLVQAEFDSTVKMCKTSLTAMGDMAQVILQSQSLKQMSHLILLTGNVLNYGTYNGDSAGYKVTTLLQLVDVKSVTPCKSLLHHIVQIVMDQDKHVLDFVKQILPLESAAICSMEEMKVDISKLNSKLQCFMVKLSNANTRLQNMFHQFIEVLKAEFKEIQQLTVDLRNLTDDLGEYFCEDVSRFNLQDCYQCLLTFCKEINKCRADITCMGKLQKTQNKKTGDILQKRLKNKLLSLEFGQNAGANSSMLEIEKVKVLEKLLGQLHGGNFNPCMKTGQVTPDKECGHPLEMSCIPFEGSPLQHRQGASQTDNVFLDTPELVCAGYESGGSGAMSRSSTQRIVPITETCTAQTVNQPNTKQPSKTSLRVIQRHTSSPIRGELAPSSGTLQRKLFPKGDVIETDQGHTEAKVTETGYREREIDVAGCQPTQKPKRRLELPGRRGNHCRSRSDLTDSICTANKWIEYEKLRNGDLQDMKKAPIAEPESLCNLSILNLETKGKFITNHDVCRLNKDVGRQPDKMATENNPAFERFHKNRKSEKKSSVGGFFSRIGRAVLKPRNVYSEGDEYEVVARKSMKTSSLSDKENVAVKQTVDERFGVRDSKRFKSGNKVSQLFQRGGLYRSSKMKKRQQQQQEQNG